MRIADNILLLTYHELVPKVISKETFNKARLRGNLQTTTRGGNGRMVEVVYESLPEKYKRLVNEQYGNPYEFAANSAIKQHLNTDLKAIKFYREYRLDINQGLNEEVQYAYVKAAEWLNMINYLTGKGSGELRRMNLTREQFWATVCQLIATEQIELPASYSRLTRKLNEYLPDNYAALISKKYGNRNSEKINEEAGEWLIAEYSLPVMINSRQLWIKYNQEAESRGWPQLESDQTIYKYLHQPAIRQVWTAPRHGEKYARQLYGYQIKTKLPSYREALWESDGTDLNFRCRDRDGNPVYGLKIYAVIDVHSELILGYKVAFSEKGINVYEAVRNAIQFAQHKPLEWRYDGGSGHTSGVNQEFFDRVAKTHFKVRPYNGKSKTIESVFGRFQQQIQRQYWFYKGQNITAKSQNSRGNEEWLNANQKNWPYIDQIIDIVVPDCVKAWNEGQHHKSKKSRLETYLSSVNPQPIPVDELDMVNLFWLTTGKTRKYYTGGIKLDEGKLKAEFEVLDRNGMPDADFRSKYIHDSFYIKYDPADLSLVYLCQGEPSNLHIVAMAQPRIEVHRALVDRTEGEGSMIKGLQAFEKQEHTNRIQRSQEILERNQRNPEQLIQSYAEYLKQREEEREPVYQRVSLYGNEDYEEGKPLA